ncbi:MAG: MarR family transcriptional regulator [Nanoarchaeota archaeon]|nr:MarR family transcriptional regulator [DPANN group archaeon]MBL7116204.1 MarR family transcriptional regulator [Nanoarchaeota archaeon]
MKLKKLKIRIESEKKYHKRVEKSLKKIDERRADSFKDDSISFNSLEQFRKFITSKKIELLRVIKEKKPTSVYALAKIVKRNTENVNRDLKELELMGFVNLKKEKSARRKIKPQVDYESIEINIPV